MPRPSNALPGGHNGTDRAFLPTWAFSRWGLPCHACHQARGALLPHPFTLTGDRGRLGGLLSAALSLGLPPVVVNHHRALRSPDFPRRGLSPAAAARATLPAHSSDARPCRGQTVLVQVQILAKQHHGCRRVEVSLGLLFRIARLTPHRLRFLGGVTLVDLFDLRAFR